MKERGWIESIVDRVVGQVLDSHAAQLRGEIVRRVTEEVVTAPHLVETPATAAGKASAGAAGLARAVAEIHLGGSQREILRALLDTSARYAARVALFVVKGSHATGWQARGFSNCEAVKDFALDENSVALIRALRDRIPVSATIAAMDSRFLREVGAPASGEARIFPLILKDKVAALVYADGGSDEIGLLDAGSVELLVLATGAWLEVNSLRKQAHREQTAAPVEGDYTPAADAHQAAVQAVSAYTGSFATPAPAQALAAAASAGEGFAVDQVAAAPAPTAEGQSLIAESASAVEMLPVAEPMPGAGDSSGYAPTEAPPEAAPAMAPVSAIPPEEQETHQKAQRFARLLVDEIKLYNQAKVVEGRNNRDLYDRLKEVIEKSRATYQKRYGSTVAASGNYFHHEIIRSLAEDDRSILGANFQE